MHASYPCATCRRDAGPGHEFKFTHAGTYYEGPPLCDDCYPRIQRNARRLGLRVTLDWLNHVVTRQVPAKLWLRAFLVGCWRGRLLQVPTAPPREPALPER